MFDYRVALRGQKYGCCHAIGRVDLSRPKLNDILNHSPIFFSFFFFFFSITFRATCLANVTLGNVSCKLYIFPPQCRQNLRDKLHETFHSVTAP